jgi:hypothetical protein
MCLDNATSTGIYPVLSLSLKHFAVQQKFARQVCRLRREREMLRSRLAKLMGFDLWPRPKEVLMAVWEKGFPLLAYRLVHPNGYMAECYLLFLQEKIKDIIIIWCRRCWDALRGLKKLAPRLIARGWKAEGVFADCCNDTGRRLNSRCCVVTLELRDSQIHTSFCPSQCRCHRASEFSPKVRASRTT